MTYTKMNPEIKEQWIEALLSGDYKQGKNLLCKTTEDGNPENDQFCCMGVLSDLAYKAGVIPAPTKIEETNDHAGCCGSEKLYVYRYGPDTGGSNAPYSNGYNNARVPTYAVCEWAGLMYKDPDDESHVLEANNNGILPRDDMTSLTSLNDAGVPFAEIAEVIREQF